jgi:hypothetical protein
MPLHTDSHILHSTLRATLRALQMPGDLLYKAAILAVAVLLLLTVWV